MRNEESTTIKSNQKKMTPREMINHKSRNRNQKPPSSYSEMKKMIEDFESRFIMPSRQPELDGVFGVTLKDIATSLGVAHKDLRRKLETSGDLEFIQPERKTSSFRWRMPELPFKNTQEFCHYVREEAKHKNMALIQVFTESGMDRSNFYKYEKGKCRVTLETASRVYESLKSA